MTISPSTEQKLTVHLSKSVPRFIESEYPVFVEFMEAYYEWLSQSGYAYESAHNMLKYGSIDTTIDEFVEHFRTTYMFNIPQNILANKRLLVKHIKDFYLAKGTEKAYKLLFRMLYNENVNFYYPNRDILRVSDGKWHIPKSIRTTSTGAFYSESPNCLVRGMTSDATAVVEEVVRFTQQSMEVTEFFLSQLVGAFEIGETIEIRNRDGVLLVSDTILPVFTGVIVTGGGDDYARGSDFYITTSDTNAEQVAHGTVVAVESGLPTGPATKVKFLTYGIADFDDPVVDFTLSGDGTATGTPVIGAMITYQGAYVGTDGQVSSDKKIQDSYYYQDYSYVLRSPVLFNVYKDIILKTIHPAGMLLFGETVLNSGSVSLVHGPMSLVTYQEFMKILISVISNPNAVQLSDNLTTLLDTSLFTVVFYETINELPIGRIGTLYHGPISDLFGSEINDPIPEIFAPPITRKGTPGLFISDNFSSIFVST